MRRLRISPPLMAVAATLAAAIPVGLAEPPASVAAVAPAQALPGQRIDMKVLLLTAPDAPGATVPNAWVADLEREGTPYDRVDVRGTVSAVLSDARLADYAGSRAHYQAVIVDTPISAADEAALARLEATFGVRRFSDNTFPSAEHGLNPPTVSAPQDGALATLTPTGKEVFPYLKGDVPIADESPTVDEAYGWQATPISTESFTTLLTGPNGSSYLGIHTRPDGREEMVMTLASNQFQSHKQLLRHGILNWVTRGVYLGFQRNYLEMQADDIFLGDDAWIPASYTPRPGQTCIPVKQTTGFCEEDIIRLTRADVERAAAWSRQNGLRIDMVFNGAGEDPPEVLAAFQANKDAFGWINHTLGHPNLDCSTRNFIANQVTDNIRWAQDRGLPVDPSELVTGEHSGLANSRPGNPGTIDPPFYDDEPVVAADATSTLAAGTYEYAISARSTKGETLASRTTVTVGAGESVALSWENICHAVGYRVYRRTAAAGQPAGAWAQLAAPAPPVPGFTDQGAATVRFTDAGAAGTPSPGPLAASTATLDPYPQNPNLLPALRQAGVRTVATDASKAYPNPATAPVPPTGLTGPSFAAGSTFLVDGAGGSIRAIPRYPSNVFYNAGTKTQELDEYNWIYNAAKGCDTTTRQDCKDADVTWDELLASEVGIMFRHVMGNDPRPHYFHESNLANTTLPGDEGGILYTVMDKLLARYRQHFSTPLVQLTHTQIGAELARQAQWLADQGKVTAWLQDGRVHIANPSSASVVLPLTGTQVGEVYGGHRSGWTTIAAQTADAVFETSVPVVVTPTPPATPGAGAAPAPAPAPPSTGTDVTVRPRVAPSLTRVRLSPRRFAVARRPTRSARSGARLGWRLDRAATIRLVLERRTVTRGSARLRPAGSVRLQGKAGAGSVRFTGRVGRRTLKPGRYRMTVTAVDAAGLRSTPRRISFRVVRG